MDTKGTDEIVLTNYGGPGSNEIDKIFVSFNGGLNMDLTDKLKHKGDSASWKRETKPEPVVVTAKFRDGKTQVVFDSKM